MIFIDLRISVRKGAAPSKTKLLVGEEELLIAVTKKAIGRYVDNNVECTDDADTAFNRIKSVSCNNSDLTEYNVDDPAATLSAMNSVDTPIFEKGIDIILTPIIEKSNGATKKAKRCAQDILMGKVTLELNYLQGEKDLDDEPSIDVQIMEELHTLFEENNIGYRGDAQKRALKSNMEHMKNALCFIIKFWKVLFRADYPHIPSGGEDYGSSQLLMALAENVTQNQQMSQNQQKKKRWEQISIQKIANHINTLEKCDWGLFVAVSAMKTAISFIKDEIKIVCVLLKRHKDVLSSNSVQKKKTILTPSPKRGRSITATFKDSMALVQISDNEFHTEVDPAFKNNKKKPGRVGKFGACVKISVDSVVAKLRATDDYSPIFLCDETMGIDKYSLAIGEPFLHPSARSQYREQYRIQLRDCVKKMCIHIFGQTNSGQNPDYIFVWKVPAIHGQQHVGEVAKAIMHCREMAPKAIAKESVKHFNAIIDRTTGLPAGARKALCNYIFCGNPNPNDLIADDYVQFVLDLTAGQVCISFQPFLLSYHTASDISHSILLSHAQFKSTAN